MRRKIIKTFNLFWLDSSEGKKMGHVFKPLLLRKAWLVVSLTCE